MMFSPMKTPGRPRTALPIPTSDFIKHPAPSPEVSSTQRRYCSFLSFPQIKRTRALVVPAHLQNKVDGSDNKDDFPRPGKQFIVALARVHLHRYLHTLHALIHFHLAIFRRET
jgi:hypothetical protein